MDTVANAVFFMQIPSRSWNLHGISCVAKVKCVRKGRRKDATAQFPPSAFADIAGEREKAAAFCEERNGFFFRAYD
ncbi:MAG: hypothetical protein MJ202_00120 [Lentisphaeria bacterium]|nr:hypothetical protein [Lentisphaeria bacterium]